MTHLLRAGDLIGLPVVSIATGEDLAEVRDVIYDGSEHRLLGFTLNKRGMFAGRLKEVLTAESVTGIGAGSRLSLPGFTVENPSFRLAADVVHGRLVVHPLD